MALPPLLTNNFHPEVGLPELTARLREAGHRVVQRDHNVELVYGEMTRGSALLSLALWALEQAPREIPLPRDGRGWKSLVAAAAEASRLGPSLSGVDLSTYLRLVRRRTNRSHRPDDGWRSHRPPLLGDDLLGGLRERDRESARTFVSLCVEEDDFWIELVEALAWLLWAPRTLSASDVLAAAARDDLPLLAPYVGAAVEGLARELDEPDLVGLSLHGHDQLVPALAFLRRIRDVFPKALTVVGGPFCTAAHEVLQQVPRFFELVDAVVVGAGHEPLGRLLARHLEGRGVAGTPGTLSLGGAGVVFAPPSETPRLESLPFPTFDGLPIGLYPDARLPVRLHDGCPWGRCRFCYHVFPDVHRTGAPPVDAAYVERAVARMATLAAETGIRRFVLLDHAVPFATLDRLAAEVVDRGHALEWDTMARFERGITPERGRRLHEGGGRDVLMGLETTSPDELRALRKGIDLGTVDRAIEALAAAGLCVRLFLLSYPGQSLEDLRSAFEWALSRCPDVSDAMIGRFTLGRSTRSWQARNELGLELVEADDPCLDVFQTPFNASAEVPFEDYEAFWLDAKERFRSARTAAETTSPTTAVRRGRLDEEGPARRVTLVGTGIDAPHARGESRRYNLAIGSLAAQLSADSRGAGVETTVVQVPFSLDSPTYPGDVVERVLDSAPEVLGLSCYAWDLDAQLHLAEQVRTARPETRIVAGGPSVSYDSGALLARTPALDAVIAGEGEVSFLAFLRGEHAAGEGVPGIFWRDADGAVRGGGMARPVADLSTLSSPLLGGADHPPRENLLLELSRGCLYRCRHCAWQTHGKGVRTVPKERIREEVAWARDRGYSHAFIIDSSINWNDEWLQTVVEAIGEGDPQQELFFSYFLDYRFVTAEQAKLVARIRTHEVLVGLESVNDRALRATGRGSAVEEPFARALDVLAPAVGSVTPNVMFAMPGDDLDGFRRTLDYVADQAERPGPRRIRHVRVHWTIVPPGSYFHRHADRHGIRVHDRGIPYVIGTDTFPGDDIRRGLELIDGHRRADLVVWEDAEPVRILGGELPKVGMPGGGALGGEEPEPIGDEELLRALAPLEPGSPVGRQWTLGKIVRRSGWPILTLSHAGGRSVSLELRRRGSDPRPLARAGPYDILRAAAQGQGAPDELHRRLAEVVARVITRAGRRT